MRRAILRSWAEMPTDQVDHEEAHVGAADGALGAHGREDLDRGIHAGALAQARGVDESVTLACAVVGNVDRVTGGARQFRDDGALVLEDRIDERGFTGIWFAHHRDLQPSNAGGLFRLAGRLRKGSETGVEFLHEFGKLAAMGGGDRMARAQTKARKVA